MNWYYNLKISTKLLSAFILVALIAAVIGAVGIIKLNQLDVNSQRMYEKITVPINELGEISTIYQRIRINIRDLVSADNANDRQKAQDTIAKLQAEINKTTSEFEKTILTDEGRKLFDEFKKSYADYTHVITKIAQLSINSKDKEALEVMRTDGRKVAFALQEAIDKLQDSKLKQSRLTNEENNRAASAARTIIISFTIIGLILAVLLGLFIARSISKPLQQGVHFAQAVAVGDLTQTIHLDQKDEIGQLATALNEMVQALLDITSQTVEASNQVSIAADQISEANQSFSQKITEQAASVEETTATMEEMSASIKSTAENSREASNLARSSKSLADGGSQVMHDTIKAMDEINKSSRKIANISDVIEEIAFQTNLLALNAAVEAARAGEHGKGFAVVAAEIRSLAQRTTQSAKEINGLIEDSSEKTGKGVELAQELSKKLAEIGISIKKVTDLMDEVAAASQEQSAGINQVNTAMGQVDQATQANASLVEETSGAAEELAAQARSLLDVVSFFKVEDNSHRRGAIRREALKPVAKSPARRQTALPAKPGSATHDQNDFSDF